MTVSYTTEDHDVLANRRWQLQRPEGKAVVRREYLSGLIPSLFACSAFLLVIWFGHRQFPLAIALPIGIGLTWVVWHAYYHYALRQAGLKYVATAGRAALGLHSMTLSAEGISEQRPQGSVSHHWSAVDEIATTNDHIFISVGGDGTYIVPRRSLSQAGTDAPFIAELRSLHAQYCKGRLPE